MRAESILLSAETFKQEHELIEQELIELETIMKTEVINYPNLIHTLKKLNVAWESHERREHSYFDQLNAHGLKMPGRISLNNGKLKRCWNNLINALRSGSEFKTREALMTYGTSLINEIRQQMVKEDGVLYALPQELQQTTVS